MTTAPISANEHRYNQHIGRAKRLLTHYISYVWNKSDLAWGYDTQSEVEAIADHIVEAAVAKLLMLQEEAA